MALLRTLLLLCLIAAMTSAVWAEETINEFKTLIEVQKNGDVIVTETIQVNVEGQQIRRGIFRDIPRYQLLDGKYKVPQRISVRAVDRNGKASNYMKENQGNALHIRIGDADYFLPHGIHAYEIKYRMSNQVRYFDNYDEIYWNATGTYWAFPIKKAIAIVNLPSGATIQGQDAFTGYRGSTDASYRYSANADNHIFTATRELAPREGLTVSLRFDKGLIDPPTAAEKGFLWWVRNGALILFSLTLLGITAYYYRAWDKVGRDPAKGPVFARYEPPKGYSAAGVSHIHYKGVRGHKPLIATMMGLAIKGYLKLDTGKKKTIIQRLENSGNEQPLSDEENNLLQRLFPHGKSGTITLKGKYNPRFYKAKTSFETHLGKIFGKDYFRWNIGYTLLGMFLSIGAFVLAISQIYGYFKPGYLVLILALIAVNILFAFLMPAPSKKGQKISTEIDGFKLYMDKAEKLQLNAVEVGSDQPPPMTTERYEKFLPYAVALGVEKPWSKYFEKVMPVEAENYNPAWSHGNFSSGRSISRMTDSMVSSLSSGVSSARPPSSSSSGGGGGSSGGGGGGGGGGGW